MIAKTENKDIMQTVLNPRIQPRTKHNDIFNTTKRICELKNIARMQTNMNDINWLKKKLQLLHPNDKYSISFWSKKLSKSSFDELPEQKNIPIKNPNIKIMKNKNICLQFCL